MNIDTVLPLSPLVLTISGGIGARFGVWRNFFLSFLFCFIDFIIMIIIIVVNLNKVNKQVQ